MDERIPCFRACAPKRCCAATSRQGHGQYCDGRESHCEPAIIPKPTEGTPGESRLARGCADLLLSRALFTMQLIVCRQIVVNLGSWGHAPVGISIEKSARSRPASLPGADRAVPGSAGRRCGASSDLCGRCRAGRTEPFVREHHPDVAGIGRFLEPARASPGSSSPRVIRVRAGASRAARLILSRPSCLAVSK